MTRCIEANRPPGGLTVHLVEGHAVDLHIAGVTAGTLHWADGRRVEVAPSLPGTASGDGLGWSLDAALTAELRAAGVAYVQLVADDRVLMAGDVAWHSGWRGSCQPHQRVVYVAGPPGDPGVGIADVTAVDGVATITLTNGSTRTIDLPPGADGHTPVVGLEDDRLTVDGVPVGGSLRGPAGHTPEVVVSGDVVTIDGQSTDPLTGPPIPTRWEGTALVVGDLPPVELASTVPGPPGPPGPPGDKGDPGADADLPAISWEGDRLRVGDALSPSLTGPGGGVTSTGVRNILSLVDTTYFSTAQTATNYLYLVRSGDVCHMYGRLNVLQSPSNPAVGVRLFTDPNALVGYRAKPQLAPIRTGSVTNGWNPTSAQYLTRAFPGTDPLQVAQITAGTNITIDMMWMAHDPMPAPPYIGTPA